MENRDRDKVSGNNESSTEAGDINRETSQREGQEKSDSDPTFRQKIGSSENIENEPSRRTGSDSSETSRNPGRSMGSMSEH